jgi:hypothetical protein
MATETRLEWVEVSSDSMSRDSRKGRYLWVANEMSGHATVLPPSVSIREALANYADDHVIGGARQKVTVTYQLWQDGEISVSGKHTFEAEH